MRDWYRPRDLLTGISEHVIAEQSTLAETVSLILAQTGLLDCRPGPDGGQGRAAAQTWPDARGQDTLVREP